MNLKKWCANYGHGAKAYLARECGVRYATIHHLVSKGGWATIPTAKAIEKATDGKVPWLSLINAQVRKEIMAAARN